MELVMQGVVRSAMLGGSVFLFFATAWTLFKWLFIPLAIMTGYNKWYEQETGTDILRAQELAHVQAQRALVTFSPVVFTFDTPGTFAFPDAKVTISNNSDGVASAIKLVCTIPVTDFTIDEDGDRVPSTQQFTYTVRVPGNKVLRAHQSKTFKLDTPMISQPRQLGTYPIDCKSLFDFQPSPKV